jgi:hypothetical protein
MTLQEDDIETVDTDVPAISPASPVKAQRVRATVDSAAGMFTISDSGGVHTYSTAGLSDTVQAHLALLGLRRVVATAKDPAAAYARLQAGQTPGQRGPGKPKEMNPWRLAYAHAKVEATKRTDAPLSLDDAKAAAAALPRDKLVEIKTHPLVVKHYAKLTGAVAELV